MSAVYQIGQNAFLVKDIVLGWRVGVHPVCKLDQESLKVLKQFLTNLPKPIRENMDGLDEAIAKAERHNGEKVLQTLFNELEQEEKTLLKAKEKVLLEIEKNNKKKAWAFAVLRLSKITGNSVLNARYEGDKHWETSLPEFVDKLEVENNMLTARGFEGNVYATLDRTTLIGKTYVSTYTKQYDDVYHWCVDTIRKFW